MATQKTWTTSQAAISESFVRRPSPYRTSRAQPEVKFDYPRDPKSLTEFVAEVLAESNKPKRFSNVLHRRRSTIRTSRLDPKPVARPSTRQRGRLKMRQSMVDYERANLNNHDLDYYYERVYIVARNIPTEQEDFQEEFVEEIQQDNEDPEDVHPLLPMAKTPVPVVLQLRKPSRLKNSIQLDEKLQAIEEQVEVEDKAVEQPVEEPNEAVEALPSEAEVAHVVYDEYIDEDKSRDAMDSDYSMYAQVEKDVNRFDMPDYTDQRESLTQADFLNYFEELIEEIKERSERDLFDAGELGGLLLCMGDYTVLVIEGIEDLVTEFLKDLLLVIDYWWSDNRVLAIEDIVDKSYFIPTFRCYRMAPIYTNEKFPTATPNDPYMMREQHKKVFDKLQALVRNLGGLEVPFARHSLPSHTYNKLMPEVQRLDLILSCKRYYRTLQQFIQSHDILASRNDDIAMLWPCPYNYTPYMIFTHSHYDTNLTFPNYGEVETKKPKRRVTVDDDDRRSLAEPRKSGAEGEEEDDDDDDGPDEEEWVDQEPEDNVSQEQKIASTHTLAFDIIADDLVSCDSSFYDPLLNIEILKPRRLTGEVATIVPKKVRQRAVVPAPETRERARLLRWGKGRDKRGRYSAGMRMRVSTKDSPEPGKTVGARDFATGRSSDRSPGREL